MVVQGSGSVDAARLSELIGFIYECALDPAGWANALAGITQTMNAAYTTISLVRPADVLGRFAAASPWDPERMSELQHYAIDEIPGLGLALQGDVDQPVATLRAMSESTLKRTRFYREWVQPQGLHEACIVKFVHNSDRIGLLGCTTRADRPAISAEEVNMFALLSPHVRRAAMIGDLLDHQRLEIAHLTETLDQLTTAIILVDGEGRMIHGNAAAEAMLEGEGLLTLTRGAIRVDDPLAQRALDQALRLSIESDRAAIGGQGIAIPIKRRGRTARVAYVLPLSGTRTGMSSAVAALFVAKGEAAPTSTEVLVGLFDLTPTEARVMLSIGSGAEHDAAAAAHGIGRNTLKTHLSRVFAKTGANNQASLMRILAEVTAPLRV